MIFTDSKGNPFIEPNREDFSTDYAFVVAYNEYKRAIDAEASRAVYHCKVKK